MTHWLRTGCTFLFVVIMFSTAPAPVGAQDEPELTKTTRSTVADLFSRARSVASIPEAQIEDVG